MSAKRTKRVPKNGPVWRMSADEATLAGKPRYNGYACGHGAHGDAKFNRAKSKRAWKQQMMREGARKGSFLYMPQLGITPGPRRCARNDVNVAECRALNCMHAVDATAMPQQGFLLCSELKG